MGQAEKVAVTWYDHDCPWITKDCVRHMKVSYVSRHLLEPKPQSRQRATLTRLLLVANAYNAALREGRHDPTVAVGQALGVSRSQAAKLVQKCRATTPPLLGPSGHIGDWTKSVGDCAVGCLTLLRHE